MNENPYEKYMNPLDEYMGVSWCYAGFYCDKCDTYLTQENLDDCAEQAMNLGWVVTPNESNTWDITCPECAKEIK